MRLRCPSYSVDVDVDVDVNELSHRLICTELLKENQVAPPGRLRQCGPTTQKLDQEW